VAEQIREAVGDIWSAAYVDPSGRKNTRIQAATNGDARWGRVTMRTRYSRPRQSRDKSKRLEAAVMDKTGGQVDVVGKKSKAPRLVFKKDSWTWVGNRRRVRK